MTRYYFLDECGDSGLTNVDGSSTHFVLAMVRLTSHEPLREFATLRQLLYLPPTMEFKYNQARPHQKELFFTNIRTIPFQVRAIVIEKPHLRLHYQNLTGPEIAVEFTKRLILRASDLDIANDILMIDGAVPSLIRTLRIKLSKECRLTNRVRPFKKIVYGNSKNEDGLQLADMIAGAIMQYAKGLNHKYYLSFKEKVVDMWQVSERGE